MDGPEGYASTGDGEPDPFTDEEGSETSPDDGGPDPFTDSVGTDADGRVGFVALFALLAILVVAAAAFGSVASDVPSAADSAPDLGLGTPEGGSSTDGSSHGTQPATIRSNAAAVGQGGSTATADLQATASVPGGGTGDAGADVNATLIEREIHERINEIRRNRSLPPLNYSERLAEIAAYHSRDMAAEEYFAHVAPDNETLSDRYDRFGYDCRVPITDRRYATGAENIAYTYAFARVRTERGVASYDGNETRMARGIVRGWMNSPGHRRNVLRPYWEREGIGVAFDSEGDRTQVIATQNFC